ncbi:MAG: prepilin peptidase [Patescibacteria group bacterium]
MPIILVFVFILGTIYGSFLNVLLWRLPEGQRIDGRSYCRSCRRQLVWFDLIPILSFIILGGRCRYCHNRIHVRYPIVEMSTGIILALFFAFRQPLLNLETVMIVFALLILASLLFFDLFYLILPDVLALPAIAVFAIYDLAKTANPLSYFLTALLSAGFFVILYAVSRGKSLGFGDVKLAFLVGLILGWPFGFFAIIGGIWLAAIVAVFLLILRQAKLKDKIPLGSFLALSTILCIIFYHELLPLTTFFR